ncbi:UspA domain protein [Methanosalsum zhilinae DSM 4017]|uniref:UspA domain protein n=1 Tax=Methanosalsum zhilinae (strain DSM 4017 / NBRC 107636 / OCM 62 / WeN5) TaxID=679901 RepID=F7XPF2_METZD|nr:universal stress protein [Methanosalsum zhilinae]AEH60280.1 UspA domain protein [Methanosalsum zhilinae DSM 4017]
MVFKKILIATDGSTCSQQAAINGIKIASSTGAKVYAVYVIHTSRLATISEGREWVPPYDVLKEVGKEATLNVRKMAHDKNLNVETVLLEGDPCKEILAFADKKNVDLIVIGTMGKSKVLKVLIGSTAEKIIKNSNIPVLISK